MCINVNLAVITCAAHLEDVLSIDILVASGHRWQICVKLCFSLDWRRFKVIRGSDFPRARVSCM